MNDHDIFGFAINAEHQAIAANERVGFRFGDKGTHTSRTIMLDDLSALLRVASPEAKRVRQDCEVLRATPRHGTRRRLSALSVGILLMSLARSAALAERVLDRLLAAPQWGLAVADLAAWSP